MQEPEVPAFYFICLGVPPPLTTDEGQWPGGGCLTSFSFCTCPLYFTRVFLSYLMPSHFIGIFSVGPSILFYFFRGSTPLATDEGIVVRTYICGMYPFAKPPIGLILHTCICIHISITPQKRGLNCGSMTCPTGGAPNINYGKNNYGKSNYGKNNYGKTGQSALAPWFYRKNQLWK